jgi:hypothetical protein
MKTLVDHRGTERDEHVEAMTGPQINGCLDELFASNRLDEDAYATGNRLLSAWISLEPQAAFHWCQAHYFEFAAGLTTDLFQHIAADDPAQAEAFCAQLKTSALRKEALTGIAEAARPGEESRTLDHLLAFGTPGEEAAGRWIVELADNRPEEVTSLKAMIRAKKQTSAKWRSATLTRLKTVPTVDDFDLSGSGK